MGATSKSSLSYKAKQLQSTINDESQRHQESFHKGRYIETHDDVTSVHMGLLQPRRRQSLLAQERASHLDQAQPSRIRSSEAREVRVLAL
jgi:hypothetical protein